MALHVNVISKPDILSKHNSLNTYMKGYLDRRQLGRRVKERNSAEKVGNLR